VLVAFISFLQDQPVQGAVEHAQNLGPREQMAQYREGWLPDSGFGTIGTMSKAFTKEPDGDEDDDLALPPLPAGSRNYMTPQGYHRLRTELFNLLDIERPKIVEIVHWAASNGDRSENGDYLYGKKRLREIDRRIRFLTKRLDIAEVADPSQHHGKDQIFFGATVTYENQAGVSRTITIKGIDEADALQGEVSWVSPIARALIKAREGDEVQLLTPGGLERLEVIEVRYPPPQTAH